VGDMATEAGKASARRALKMMRQTIDRTRYSSDAGYGAQKGKRDAGSLENTANRLFLCERVILEEITAAVSVVWCRDTTAVLTITTAQGRRGPCAPARVARISDRRRFYRPRQNAAPR